MVRIERSSGGRPDSDIGMPPRPIGKTSAVASLRVSTVIEKGLPSALLGITDVGRVEGVAQALVARVAQRAGVGDVAIVGGRHELGLDEVDRLGRRRAGGERAGVAGQRLE